jgi:hypothetical protein
LNSLIKIILASSIVLFLASCGSDRKVPDVSNIKVDIKINRLEDELFAIDTNHVAEGWRMFKAKYPDFAAVFPRVIGVNIPDSTQTLEALNFFLKDKDIRLQYDTCKIVYKDIKSIEADLTQALKYYKYYFPKQAIPSVNSCITGLNYGCFIYGDSIPSIGLGWEFYLGKSYTGYEFNPDRFPRYIARSMNRTHLVSKTIENLVQDVMTEPVGNRLLDIMVHNGKKLYIMDQLLPFAHDSVKLEYTAVQTQWINDNESNIWAHLTHENLLYSIKQDEIRKLVSPSPNAPKMPAEAPGRTANWIGWQIIKAYMKRFPNTTIEQLISTADAQKVLEMSKYKPKR